VATDSEEVEIVATPPALTALEPIGVAPSRKVTLPVGVPPGPETLAVKVTDAPNVEGFGAAVTAVVVLAFWTSCENAEEVEPLKFPSPL
jgi:hypothetical protein